MNPRFELFGSEIRVSIVSIGLLVVLSALIGLQALRRPFLAAATAVVLVVFSSVVTRQHEAQAMIRGIIGQNWSTPGPGPSCNGCRAIPFYWQALIEPTIYVAAGFVAGLLVSSLLWIKNRRANPKP
jgi:hypothetical protein